MPAPVARARARTHMHACTHGHAACVNPQWEVGRLLLVASVASICYVCACACAATAPCPAPHTHHDARECYAAWRVLNAAVARNHSVVMQLPPWAMVHEALASRQAGARRGQAAGQTQIVCALHAACCDVCTCLQPVQACCSSPQLTASVLLNTGSILAACVSRNFLMYFSYRNLAPCMHAGTRAPSLASILHCTLHDVGPRPHAPCPHLSSTTRGPAHPARRGSALLSQKP